MIIAPAWSTFSQRSSDLARIQRAWLARAGVHGPRRYARCPYTHMLGQRAQQLPAARRLAVNSQLLRTRPQPDSRQAKSTCRSRSRRRTFACMAIFVVACQASRLVGGCALAKAVTSCSTGMPNFSTSSPKAGEILNARQSNASLSLFPASKR